VQRASFGLGFVGFEEICCFDQLEVYGKDQAPISVLDVHNGQTKFLKFWIWLENLRHSGTQMAQMECPHFGTILGK
jgi:hypothetical protein